MEEGGPSNPWGDVVILDDSNNKDVLIEDVEDVFEEGHVVHPAVDVPVIALDDDENPEMGLGLEDLEDFEGQDEDGFVDDIIQIDEIVGREPVDDPDDEGPIDWDDVLLHINDPSPEGWDDEEDPEEDLPAEAEEMALEDMSEPEYDPVWDELEEEELVIEPAVVELVQPMEAMVLDSVADAQAANEMAH